jgi:hypothetical protein
MTVGMLAVEVLKQRIERLQEANITHDGWRDVVVRRDIDNLCSDFDKFIIRQKMLYTILLSLHYSITRDEFIKMDGGLLCFCFTHFTRPFQEATQEWIGCLQHEQRLWRSATTDA